MAFWNPTELWISIPNGKPSTDYASQNVADAEALLPPAGGGASGDGMPFLAVYGDWSFDKEPATALLDPPIEEVDFLFHSDEKRVMNIATAISETGNIIIEITPTPDWEV